MKKNKSVITIAILVPLIVILLSHFNIGRVLDLKLLDWRFVLRGEQPASEKVFIIAMGDESVSPKAIGRWPWRRIYMAILIDILKQYNPNTLVFDILFTEPSEGEQVGDDAALAEQAGIMKKVFFPFYCLPETEEKVRGYDEEQDPVNEQLIEKISIGKASSFKGAEFINTKNIVMPIPLLSKNASGSGYVNAIPDSDGVTRRIPLVMQYRDYLIPNVAFYAVLKYLNIDKDGVTIRPGKHIILKNASKQIKIPVDNKCQMLINHYGQFSKENIKMGSFINIIESAESIMNNETPPIDLNQLKGKIIFVGLTATGTADLRPTPFSPIYAMVGLLASVSSNILENDFPVPVSKGVNYLIIILTGFLASLLTVRFRAIISAVSGIVLIIVFFFINLVFFKNNIVISAFYPIFSIVLSYTALTIYRFTVEEKEKKAIRGTFQRYVSSKVVDVLLEHPEEIKLGGERKRLTVFFSDIRGFTSISEKLQPEEVVSILNEYLTEMIDIIFEYNGTLDKFIGDAVMAVWGAPVKQDNHAELAVRAACAMRKKINELQEKWQKEGKKQIGVGMGINTGDVVVGNMGSDQFSDYTVIGDNVNLAARLEENAKSDQIIISESTYEEVEDILEVNKLEPLKVKGKEKTIKVYEIVKMIE